MNGVLKKIFAKVPKGKFRKEKIGSVNAYIINAGFAQVYAGLKDRVFIIASNRMIFEESLRILCSSGSTRQACCVAAIATGHSRHSIP